MGWWDPRLFPRLIPVLAGRHAEELAEGAREVSRRAQEGSRPLTGELARPFRVESQGALSSNPRCAFLPNARGFDQLGLWRTEGAGFEPA